MKSPFPGMDPFLQRRWGSFSTTFLVYLSDAINPILPPRLRARIEVRGDEFDDDPVDRRLDVPPQQRLIVICDLDAGATPVTTIEMVNPSNKAGGRRRREYRDRQAEHIDAGVNLLELDFVCGGRPTTLCALAGIPPAYQSLYHASLFTNTPLHADHLQLHPIPLDKPQPRIPLPLRRTDRPIVLDLQAVLDVTYERGYYAGDLRYHHPLDPPLSPADAAYVQERITAWRESAASKADA